MNWLGWTLVAIYGIAATALLLAFLMQDEGD